MRLDNLEQVGKGGFTRCYELDSKTVLLESFDPIKELMANGGFPKSRMFPKVKHYSKPKKYDGVGGNFYEMKYYKGRPKRSTMKWLRENLDPDQFEIYMELYELRKEVEDSIRGQRNVNRQEVWNKAFKKLKNKKLSKKLIKAHNACCEVADSIMFDCMPKNVATYKGRLILLDCFYSSKLFFKLKMQEKPEWALDWK